MKKKNERKVIVGVVLFCVVVFSLFMSGIKVSHSLNIFAEVHPLQKWQIVKGTDGQLTSALMDYETGFSNAFGVTQFQRGESMVFSFAEWMKNKKEIKAGDSIGIIRSSDVEERIVQLEGALTVAKAEFEANRTGEKKPLITEAKNRLEFAGAKLGQKKDTFQRNEQLYKKGFLPQESYETDLWEIKQLEIEISIYQSQLEAITSGLKPETLKLLESKATALSNELDELKKRSKNFIVVSPIDGIVNRSFSPDTILSIINFDKVVMNVPLKIAYRNTLKEGESISVRFENYSEAFQGRLLSLSKEVKMLNYEQVIVAAILINNSEKQLLPGMITQGTIKLGTISIWDYLTSYILN
ncbi:MAG: hypothetical protein M0Q21_09125 [Ignavibacteriaceae bacterium]|nr:hypothetical protein [Ignavibacteriaceae bacterium]